MGLFLVSDPAICRRGTFMNSSSREKTHEKQVFLPLQMDQLLINLSRTPKTFRSTSPVESTDRDEPSAPQSTLTAAPIDVRLLTLRTFRDALILPIFERLHMLVAFSSGVEPRKDFNQPRFQQMFVLRAIAEVNAELSK